jgi:hypothetical protein
MKIITRAVFQMTADGYELLEECSYEYAGEVAESKGGGTAPAAPDPAVQTNVEAAANRYNTVGPSGSVNWDQGPVEIIGYDAKGNPQYGNHWTQQTTLNPATSSTSTTHAIRSPRSCSTRPALAFQSSQTTLSRTTARRLKWRRPSTRKRWNCWIRSSKRRRIRGSSGWRTKACPSAPKPIAIRSTSSTRTRTTRARTAAWDAITYGNELSQQQRTQNYNELAAALGSNQVQVPGAGAFTPIDAALVRTTISTKASSRASTLQQAQQRKNTQAGAGLASAAIIAM